MERMATRIPHARFTVLPGTGHLANLEQPAAFNAALFGFLAAMQHEVRA
jgi:pimeloyl-ACP methyl ester carboxylesterase